MASRQTHEESLEPEVLLAAYRGGIFPMEYEGAIHWFSPNPRGIIPIDAFHVPHGLRRALRKPWRVTRDHRFREVIRACADREETWIDARIRRAYERLYRLGFAHSIEVLWDGELVGGLYGVAIGGAFFGESMFHRKTDASKVALAALVGLLRERDFTLLDTQWTTPHLEQFGAWEIPRERYLRLLRRAVRLPVALPVPPPPRDGVALGTGLRWAEAE